MSNEVNNDELDLYKSMVYANIDDILFGIWLGENGWCFYDGADRLISIKAGKIVAPITELFADYIKTRNE